MKELKCYFHTYAGQITDNLVQICQVCIKLNLLLHYSEAYLEPYQTSKMESFVKIVNG